MGPNLRYQHRRDVSAGESHAAAYETGQRDRQYESVNAGKPRSTLLPYATTKGAIQNFTGGLAQLLAERGIRANCVAPGPIWTPLIPATLPPGNVKEFGKQTPMKRPGQPAELAPVYVMLASDEASYVSGATVAVTGGVPIT